ncbi:uncharacterized protein LOC141690898 [Apium graveolens]|uniref:uncharacterized protein LOC141690898 n=1 Tax=Apium graveolens TaxID=4045 RepID=UPI003D794472
MLSGWSTKGKLACPICNYETSSKYLKHSKKVCYMNHRKFLDPNHKWRSDKRRFNGDVETGETPTMLYGREIEVLLDGYVNTFGKGSKRKVSCETNPWNKRSIFFDLPYWRDNLIRHNLDVMHIEKNICDSVLGTLLDMGGKTKDHMNARLDLQKSGIRKVLHPITTADGKSVIRVANFDLTNKEKDIFCSVFQNAKLQHGFGSNISRCVQDRKIVGYKSHDAHIFMQYLLQIAVKKTLKPEVAISFEIEYGGPVHQRWMYSIERYLGVLIRYIRNKSKPERSIAERYLADECLTFCSRFLNDGQTTSSNQFEIPGAETEGYSIGSRKNKEGKDTKHHELMANNENSKRYKKEIIHADEICDWFKDEVGKKVKVSREVASLAKGPRRSAKQFSGYAVNGFRCTWYQDDKDSFGFTRVNFNRVCQKHDSFVMSTQVQQVFYIEDPVEKNFYYPIKRISLEFSEIGVGNTIEDDMFGKFSHDTSFRTIIENHENEVTWFRNDVPAKEITKEVPDGAND